MAFPNTYGQQGQGTLMPGQMIAVNKYNVQVEKYLSQGGFAHVYLVRTAEPVFGTTHHVLKRIAVANEAMLNEVKKEVDIMRILRGHPNIVYLIDAAWHKRPNGMFEVYILMEFCQGGGIIDMMNRRLRERLTEAEILQIFVDVCEGVAAMHNLRPPLLHRDLKIENILQASSTSYKLCDFGSATPVTQRPPSSMQELRALEADLNKHTTLQYRAPEMVDVYLRRPIDEKSDVWALGVLLYKLCYYTTPFEEHGVLAILNVQYKFPPYPVYSRQLNALIASMLREHGVHRPSVFEVLDSVHKMRGTKSRFTYNPPKPAISPRPAVSPAAPQSLPEASKLPESVISVVNGIQKREKVLEAISPMRRGRPSSPTRGRKLSGDAFNLLDTVERGPWNAKPTKAHKSGLASISTIRSPPPVTPVNNGLGDAWRVPGAKTASRQRTGTGNGFADSFSARASPSTSSPAPLSEASSAPVPVSVPAARPVPLRTNSSLRPPGGDAFESLNVFPSPKQQELTLGEARKAVSNRPTPSPQLGNQNLSASPAPTSYKAPSPVSMDNVDSRRDVSPLLKPKISSDQALAAEQRFPSLDELDAGNFGTFGNVPTLKSASTPSTVSAQSSDAPQLPPRPTASRQDATSFYPASVASALRPSADTRSVSSFASRNDGVRSQQVTGTAMREARKMQFPSMVPTKPATSSDQPKAEQFITRQSRFETGSREKLQSPGKPVLTRKHRSSVSVKQVQEPGPEASSPKKTVYGLPVTSDTRKDWLTGVSDGEDIGKPDEPAVLRASPEKRASVLVSEIPPDIGRAASFREAAPSRTKRIPVPLEHPEPIRPQPTESATRKEAMSGRQGRLTENWNPTSPKDSSSDDDADEGPEEAVGNIRPPQIAKKSQTVQRGGHKGRQGSVHDLVDLWGGGGSPKVTPAKQNKKNTTGATQSEKENNTFSNRSKSPSPVPLSKTSSKTSTSGKSSPTKPAATLSRKPSLATKHVSSSLTKQPSSPTKSRQKLSSPSRSRPQSEMLTPMQKSASDIPPRVSTKSVLSAPTSKGRSASRRSSISDLVSHYETIDEQSKGSRPGVPAPVAKPLRVHATSSTSVRTSNPMVSPTAASARFPRLSPAGSPKEAMKSSLAGGLDPPTDALAPKEEIPKRDTGSRSGSRAPSPLLQKLSSSLVDGAPDELAAAPPHTERKQAAVSLSSLLAKDSAEAASASAINDTSRRSPSPSPERPYQGVSRLIDQWQRKSEETSKPRDAAAANSTLRGANSRFRREGKVA